MSGWPATSGASDEAAARATRPVGAEGADHFSTASAMRVSCAPISASVFTASGRTITR